MSDLDTRLAAYRERLTSTGASRSVPKRMPRVRLLVALIAFVLLAAAAGWAVTRSGSQAAATTVAATPATPTAEASAPAAEAQPAAGTPTTAPLTTWRSWRTQLVETMLPSVTGEGPDRMLPSELSGYAHTPTGALLAAANIVMPLYYATDKAEWASIADSMVIWPDGARVDLADRRAEAKTPANPVPLALVGFRYISYTDGEATVRLWWRGQSTLGLITTVVWRDGDWRVAWDENAADTRVLTASDSYIPWTPTQ